MPANRCISNYFIILVHALGVKILKYILRVKLFHSLTRMGKSLFKIDHAKQACKYILERKCPYGEKHMKVR